MMLAQMRVAVGAGASFANLDRITLIAGPCQLESEDHALMLASRCADICERIGMGYVFKSSFDKANRTSDASARGVGIDAGLNILSKVKARVGCPVVTDVHDAQQCVPVAQVADILQIPAFLMRQTDLLLAAARTGRAINIKKMQSLSPWDMEFAAAKVANTGNWRVMLTERGTMFGYNNLVVDYRSLDIMKQFGYPVIFDATHSVQLPGGAGGKSGGQRQFVASLAQAAAAVGVAGLFLEVHDDPDNAPSDGPNMLDIDSLETVLRKVKAIDLIAKERYR